MRADKKKVGRLLRIARGQIDGILKMIDEDEYCMDISNQLLATQAILRRANREVLGAHMHSCVKEACQDGNIDQKIDEIMSVLDKLSR